MQKQSGNFLLQALLVITLVFAFVPVLVSRLSSREMDAQMYATTHQVGLAQTAARIYIRENASDLPYDTTVIQGRAFADTLESYGLPLGFVSRTALGQDISLVINKDIDMVSAYLELTGGNLSELQLAELARRIGFYAVQTENSVLIGIALDDVYSDVVRRNEKDVDASAFLTNLDMGNFSIENAGDVIGNRAGFDSASFNTLSVTGNEVGRKEKNEIKNIMADKTVFQSKTGEAALTLTRGNLSVGSVNARTVSSFGDTGNFTSNVAAIYDFSMTAGRTGFTGPANWYIGGNVVTSNIIFNTERLDVSSFINVSRGQDVYINSDSLEYSSRSGIETGVLAASNITLRDQTSDALAGGQSGAVVLEIRPAGTSILPDMLVTGLNNSAIKIISKPTAADDKTQDCRTIINDLKGVYNQESLAQYIICQYVFWNRLEQRINAKQCLLDGKNDCI